MKAALERFEKAMEDGDVSAASAALTSAKGAGKPGPDVQVAAARLKAAQGDANGAVTDLEALLKANPGHAGANGYLGALLVARLDHDRARPLLKKAMAQSPVPAAVAHAYGRNLAHDGRMEDAVVHLKDAAERLPGAASNHLFLGMAYAELKKWDLAAEALLKGVQLDAKDLGAWDMLARVMVERRKPDLAIKALDEALKHNPEATALRRLKVQVFADHGFHDAAMEALQEIPDGERNAEDQCVLAWVHMEAGRWEQARTAARAAVDADPKHWRAQYTLGVALENQQPMNRAAVTGAYRKALEAGDPRGEAGTRLGLLLLEKVQGQLPNVKEAISVLKAARERSRDAPGTLLNLALAHQQAGDKAACRDIARGLAERADAPEGVKDQARRLLASL